MDLLRPLCLQRAQIARSSSWIIPNASLRLIFIWFCTVLLVVFIELKDNTESFDFDLLIITQNIIFQCFQGLNSYKNWYRTQDFINNLEKLVSVIEKLTFLKILHVTKYGLIESWSFFERQAFLFYETVAIMWNFNLLLSFFILWLAPISCSSYQTPFISRYYIIMPSLTTATDRNPMDRSSHALCH